MRSEQELRAFVQLLKDEVGKRRLAEVTAKEMLEYASQRMEQADPEWTAFFTNHDNGPPWQKLVNRLKR